MKKRKKVLSLVLAIGLCFSTLSSPITYADEDPNITGSTTETVTEEKTNTDVDYQIFTEDELSTILGNSDEVTDTVTEVTDVEEVTDEVVEEDTSTIDNTTTEVIASDGDSPIDTEEPTTVEEKTTEVAEPVEIDANTLNYRLIVSANDESILTDGYVISSYEGVYLIGYENDSDRENGYNFYKDKVEFVEKDDAVFELSDEEKTEETEEVEVVNQDDALTTLNEIDTTPNYSDYIALIDTGANADVNVSVVGDDTSDTNGHGTKMLEYIKEEAPKAKVISIKAFDGKSSNVSNIYAAIKLAIEYKVSIINLSFVGVDMESNSIIKDVINEAIDNGITVVGASGNYNSDASHYVPGCIDKAIIVGACDENGEKISTSNYGKTVDFNVVATSTSEASARMSGMLVSGNGDKIFVNNYTNYDDEFIYIDDFVIQREQDDPVPAGAYYVEGRYYTNSRGYNVHYYLFWPWTSNPDKIAKWDGITVGNGDDAVCDALCVIPDNDSGVNGKFTGTLVETNDETLKKIFYYAVLKSYDVYSGNRCEFIRAFINYYLYNAKYYSDYGDIYGHDYISLSGYSDSQVASWYNEAKTATIPDNINLQLYFFKNATTHKGSTGVYQDFLVWKISNNQTYKMTIQKAGNAGESMDGIVYTVTDTTAQHNPYFDIILDKNGRAKNISNIHTGFGGTEHPFTTPTIDSNGVITFQTNRPNITEALGLQEKSVPNGSRYTRNTEWNVISGDWYPNTTKAVNLNVCNNLLEYFEYYLSIIKSGTSKYSMADTQYEVTDNSNHVFFTFTLGSDGTVTNVTKGSTSNTNSWTNTNFIFIDKYTNPSSGITYAHFKVKANTYNNSNLNGYLRIRESKAVAPYTQNTQSEVIQVPNGWHPGDAPRLHSSLNSCLAEKHPYYIAFRKSNERNQSLEGVSFSITVKDNDTGVTYSTKANNGEYSHIKGYHNAIFTGYYNVLELGKKDNGNGTKVDDPTGIYVNYTGTTNTLPSNIKPFLQELTNPEIGYSIVYIGNFYKAPTVYLEEVWGKGPKISGHNYHTTSGDIAYAYTLDTVGFNDARKSGTIVYADDFNTNYSKYFTVTETVDHRINKNDSGVDGNRYAQIKNQNDVRPYYMILRKYSSVNDTSLAGVPFAIKVTNNDTGKTYETKIESGSYSYRLNNAIYSSFYHELTYNNDGSIDVDYNRTIKCYRNDGTSYVDSNIDPDIGYAIVYLGRYTKSPTVQIKEVWGQDSVANSTWVDSVGAFADSYKKGDCKFSTLSTTHGSTAKKIYKQQCHMSETYETFNKIGVVTELDSKLFNEYNYRQVNNGITMRLNLVKICDTTDTKYIKYGDIENPNYSLQSTRYGLYTSLTEAQNATKDNIGDALCEVILNANGEITTIRNIREGFEADSNKRLIIRGDQIPTNTSHPEGYLRIYYKELVAGKGYALKKFAPPTDYIEITDDDLGTTKRIIAKDEPLKDPVPIKISKINTYTGDGIIIKNGANTVKIKVTYYAANTNNAYTKTQLENLSDVYSVSHTYSAEVNNNGEIANITINPKDFVSTWTDFPLGYLTFEETQAPSGFKTGGFKIGTIDMSSNPTIIIKEVNDEAVRYYGNTKISGLSVENNIINSDGYDITFSTNILSTSSNSKIGVSQTNETATDQLIIKGVPYNERVDFSGKLIDLSDNNKVIATGSTYWVSTGYEVENRNLRITYHYDSTKLSGHKLTSVVTVKNGDTVIKVHNENHADKAETIYYPKVQTTAKSANTGKKIMAHGSTVTLVDDISFTNLVCGNTYKIKGAVQKRKSDGTNDGVLTINGNEVTETLTVVVSDNGTVTATDSTGASATVSNVRKTNNNATVSGTVRMTFKFNSNAIEGITTTVFEDLYYNNIKVYSHANINDKLQQVHFMKIRTNFTDDDTNDEVAVRKTNATVTDKIVFEKVPFGSTITFNGTLKDKATNSDFKISGNSVTTTGVFTVNDDGTQFTHSGNIIGVENITVDEDTDCISGSLYIQYTYDSTNIGNKTLVSFIKATVENPNATPTTKTVALHEKINDLKETIYYTDIHTNANDINTKTSVATLGQTTIVDTVTLDNLVWDKTYVLTGTVHKKKINNNGTVTDLGILKQNNKDVKVTSTITIDANGNITATNASNIQFTKNADDKTTSGTLDLSFSVNTSELKGQDVVVFEDLKHNNITISMHNEISDIGQTIHVPDGGTTAMDDLTKDEVGTVKEDEDVTLIDTVALTNIAFGHTYKLKGIIMDKATGKALKINGQTITSEATFTVDNSGKVTPSNAVNKVTDRVVSDVNNDGTNDVVSFKIALPFTMSSKDLYNKDIVVYENGYFVKANGDVEIFKENDINNLGQTVHFPEVRTLATDDTYEKHVGTVSERSTLTEKAFLSNLVYGKDYELVATLVNQVTGEDIEVNGAKIQKKVTVSISNNGTVTAKDKTDNTIIYETTDKVTYASDKTLDVTVIIPFEYDSSIVGGQTTVVYEDLIHNNITVRTHHDKDDTDQQIHYYKLNITKEGLDNAIEATFKAEHNGNVVKFVKVSDGIYNILITDDDTAKYVTEINPDELGNITINGFDVGDYTFTETRTEKGKNLLSKDFTITFTPISDTDGKLKEVVLTTDGKQSTLSLDEPMVELEPNTVNVTINNSPTFKLNTGGNGTNGYYIIAILLMLCACVVFIIKRKRVR